MFRRLIGTVLDELTNQFLQVQDNVHVCTYVCMYVYYSIHNYGYFIAVLHLSSSLLFIKKLVLQTTASLIGKQKRLNTSRMPSTPSAIYVLHRRRRMSRNEVKIITAAAIFNPEKVPAHFIFLLPRMNLDFSI